MKRFARCCCLVMALILFIPVINARAASEVIFVTVNNDFLDLSENTMPIKRGGLVYIPYNIFLSFPGIHASFDSAKKVLVIFNWDYTMTFKISSGETYDENSAVYSNPAVEHNGTVYVCASDVADKFGIYCSVINTTSGTLVRLNAEKPALSDVMFVYFATSIMKDMSQKFNAPAAAPAQPQSGSSQSQPITQAPAPVEKKIYITFDNCTSAGVSGILDSMDKYGFHATFFINGDFAVSAGALIRRIACSGNSFGISSFSENSELFYSGSEQMLNELSMCNTLLDKNIKTKSRLVRTPCGSKNKLTAQMRSALTNAGYRLWDWDVRITSAKTASSLSDKVSAALAKRTSSSAVLALNGDELTASASDKIFKYLKDNAYEVETISEWQTPVNFYKLKN